MIDNIPCIIFAGGRSSRMGEDKALLPFSTEKTLTQFQLLRVQKIFKNVYISCKNKSKFDFEASFIEDVQTDEVFAPTTGFVSIFKELQDERVFVISVDTPFVDRAEIEKILENDNNSYDATIAKTLSGIQPMFGIYHRSLEENFKTMLKTNNHRLGFLLKNSNTNFVLFDDDSAFKNLNHKYEYEEALQLIK